jgi:hypothetical protein
LKRFPFLKKLQKAKKKFTKTQESLKKKKVFYFSEEKKILSMDTMDECAVNPDLAEFTPSANEGVDVGENPSLGELGVSTDGPGSLNLAVGPPSPLTGCYLLIVIGEPYTVDHKDIILQKLLKGKFLKSSFFFPLWSRKFLNNFFHIEHTTSTISSSSSVKNFFSWLTSAFFQPLFSCDVYVALKNQQTSPVVTSTNI